MPPVTNRVSGQMSTAAKPTTTPTGQGAQVQKSNLFAKLGQALVQGVMEHKADETTYGMVDLPGGIKNGIAQLVDFRFIQIAAGKKNAGEYICYAAGVVKKPKTHNGIGVEGRRTSITHNMFPTPEHPTYKTISDHVGWVMNEMAKLGVDRYQLAKGMESDPNTLERVAEMLKNQKPHFSFETREGSSEESVDRNGKWYSVQNGKDVAGPFASQQLLKAARPYIDREPMIFHQWNGLVEVVDTEDSTTSGVDDTSGRPVTTATPSANGHSTSAAEETTEGSGGEYRDDQDLDSLAEAADAGDGDAGATLTTLANEAGITDDEIASLPNWVSIVAKMKGDESETTGETTETAPEPEKPFTPEKGKMYKYLPLGKDKKPVKKAVEVDILGVDAKTKTVSAKNMEDGKSIYKNVPWTSLHK